MKVSGVLLTIGERSTDSAAASILRQTRPVCEIIVVRNRYPFHRALNEGASRVTSDFFVQVDADMVLDESCVDDLADCFQAEVGVVIGHLRDPLLKRVVGIKMFRTECFNNCRYQDTISPDTTFIESIESQGWRHIYATRNSNRALGSPPLFGSHNPVYTHDYVVKKFLVKGQRYRFRNAAESWCHCVRELRKRQHPASLVAEIAFAHGLFERMDCDRLSVPEITPEAEFLKRFFSSAKKAPPGRADLSHQLNSRDAFTRSCLLGFELRQAGAPGLFLRYLDDLVGSNQPLLSFPIIGLCHGVCLPKITAEQLEMDWEILKTFADSSPRSALADFGDALPEVRSEAV